MKNVLRKTPRPRLDDATIARIAEQETAAFIDDRFATPGMPRPIQLGEQGADISFRDDAFLEGKSARPPLKDFMTGQPLQAERQVGSLGEWLDGVGTDQGIIEDERMQGFDAILEERYQQQTEAAAVAFRRMNPDYYNTDDNYDAITRYMAETLLFKSDLDEHERVYELFRAGKWTPEEIAKAYRYLLGRGALDTDPRQLRVITAHDKREIEHMAQQDIQGAVMTYWLRRLPAAVAEDLEQTDNYAEAARMMADPRYAAAATEAAFLVFECRSDLCPGYSPTPARRQWLLKFLGGRFATVSLLMEGWKVLRQQEQNAAISHTLLPPPPEPTQDGLDYLSDEAVSELMAATLRTRAQNPHASTLISPRAKSVRTAT